jgi:cyclic beta-1,2-glucan synthetase
MARLPETGRLGIPSSWDTRERRWFNVDGVAASPEAGPIRAELLSADILEHARLARRALLSSSKHGRALLRRAHQNARVLRQHYDSIAHTAAGRGSVTPAAEWFVDNYYVVERQLQLIRDDLPSGYYRQLPKLADGELAGLPRITGIAWAYVAHTTATWTSLAS